MPDRNPLNAEVIRRQVDAFTGSDHYRFTIDGIEYDGHWAHDTRRLLDENARLNAENERIRAMTEMHRESSEQLRENLERKLIGWREQAEKAARERDTLADACGAQCREAAARTVRAEKRAAVLVEFADSVRRAQPRSSHNELDQGWNACLESIQDGLTDQILAALPVAPEMPRPPAEEGCTCSLTDPSTWTRYGDAVEPGSMYEPDPDCPERGAHTEILTAQGRAGDRNTSPAGSGRGTGVAEAEVSRQAIDSHGLKWDTIARTVIGCRCGFEADESSDCGFGDSVVAHLLALPSLPVPSTEDSQ